MVAAQKSGRFGRLIEYDPAYCYVILRRFEAMTGTSAILARTRQTFEDVAARAPSPKPRMIQMKAAPRRQDLGNTCNERQG